MQQKRKRFEVQEQLSLCCCWNPWEGMQPVAAGGSKEPADSQSGPQSYNHKELHLPSDLKELGRWFFPKDSRTEHSMVIPVFSPCETLSRSLHWATLRLDFSSIELWNNEWMLFKAAMFVVICYRSDRKLIHPHCWEKEKKQTEAGNKAYGSNTRPPHSSCSSETDSAEGDTFWERVGLWKKICLWDVLPTWVPLCYLFVKATCQCLLLKWEEALKLNFPSCTGETK